MNSDLTSFDKIEQKIGGSRKISNYIIGGMLTIGGIGFLLAKRKPIPPIVSIPPII